LLSQTAIDISFPVFLEHNSSKNSAQRPTSMSCVDKPSENNALHPCGSDGAQTITLTFGAYMK
jgi:hypothetical protein